MLVFNYIGQFIIKMLTAMFIVNACRIGFFVNIFLVKPVEALEQKQEAVWKHVLIAMVVE